MAACVLVVVFYLPVVKASTAAKLTMAVLVERERGLVFTMRRVAGKVVNMFACGRVKHRQSCGIVWNLTRSEATQPHLLYADATVATQQPL